MSPDGTGSAAGPDAVAGGRAVVFVMGPPHGGTTLFDLVLGSHPDGFSLGELKNLRDADARVARAGRVCGICEGTCPFWDGAVSRNFEARWFGSPWRRLAARLTRRDAGLYEDLFAAAPTARYLVDSSKDVAWLDARLADARDWRGVTPKLLQVTRDGRAVVNSYRRKRPERSLADHVAAWRTIVDAQDAAYAAFPSAARLRIAYEALATAPEEAAVELARFVGVTPDPAMIRYWEGDHHLIGGNLGTRTLILRKRAEEAEAEVGFGPNARRADYYRSHGFAISLDERWREEMPPDATAEFERLAGARNAPYRHGD